MGKECRITSFISELEWKAGRFRMRAISALVEYCSHCNSTAGIVISNSLLGLLLVEEAGVV